MEIVHHPNDVNMVLTCQGLMDSHEILAVHLLVDRLRFQVIGHQPEADPHQAIIHFGVMEDRIAMKRKTLFASSGVQRQKPDGSGLFLVADSKEKMSTVALSLKV